MATRLDVTTKTDALTRLRHQGIFYFYVVKGDDNIDMYKYLNGKKETPGKFCFALSFDPPWTEHLHPITVELERVYRCTAPGSTPGRAGG